MGNPADKYAWVRTPEPVDVELHYNTNLYIQFNATVNLRVLPGTSYPVYDDYQFEVGKRYRVLEETISKIDGYYWARIMLPNDVSVWVALIVGAYEMTQEENVKEENNTTTDTSQELIETQAVIKDLKDKLAAKTQECIEWESRYRTLEESNNELQNKINELEQALITLDDMVKALQATLEEKTKKLDEANAIIQSIRNLVN